MKGKEIVPGQDPLLDKALAELRKGLRKGEDPFYVDLNARRTDPSDPNSTPSPEGQASVRDGSLTHRFVAGVRRYGIQGALLIGAIIAVVLLGVYAIGFSKGRRAGSADGSQPDLSAPNTTARAVSPPVVGPSAGPKSEPLGASQAASAPRAPSSTLERTQADAPNRAPAPSARSAPIRRVTLPDRANSPPTSASPSAAKPNGLPIQTLEN